MLKLTGTSNIKFFVKRYINDNKDLFVRKTVVDIPAGKGETSRIVQEIGGEIQPYDLFPEFFQVEGLKCLKADLNLRLPIEDNSVDIIICQEGIEHIPDQLHVFQEFGRVLKQHGKLILTTPNISHLRAKISYLFTESELIKRMPANELETLWYEKNGHKYYGHVFLIGVQKLRILAAMAGFRIKKINSVRISFSSLFLCFLYPLIVVINIYSFLLNFIKNSKINRDLKKRVYLDIIKLNLNPTVQFGRHLFLVLEKDDLAMEIACFNKNSIGS